MRRQTLQQGGKGTLAVQPRCRALNGLLQPDSPTAQRAYQDYMYDRWKRLRRLTRTEAEAASSAAVVYVLGGRFMDRQDLSCAVRTLTCILT